MEHTLNCNHCGSEFVVASMQTSCPACYGHEHKKGNVDAETTEEDLEQDEENELGDEGGVFR